MSEFDPAIFGRRRDDRGPLLAAAALAVALHGLALLIPLPEPDRPNIPPPPQESGIVFKPVLRPPDLPPPAVETPVRQVRRVLVPFAEIPVQEPLLEPDFPSDAVAAVDADLPDLALGAIEAPRPIGVVDQNTAGLVLPVGIHRPQPSFPEMARRVRHTGRVILAAVIDRDGNVREIEVLHVTAPDLGFSQEAVEAVQGWRFTPGELRGHPVAVRLTVEVEFTLN